MKKHYTFWDLAGWAFTGALTMAFWMFLHVSYQDATAHGYTPEARAYMDELVMIYNEPDMSNLKPLTIKDLE